MAIRVSPLAPGVARKTLAHRFAKRVDRIRQLSTKFGLRSDRVFLVWTRYGGEARGEGDEVEIARLEILPTPRVSDQTTVQFSPFSAGTLPIGSVVIDRVSAQLTEEILMGKVIPANAARPPGAPIVEPNDFFYEIVSDDRNVQDPDGCGEANHDISRLRGNVITLRSKFRILGFPERDEGGVQFKISLERISEDRAFDGQSQIGEDLF